MMKSVSLPPLSGARASVDVYHPAGQNVAEFFPLVALPSFLSPCLKQFKELWRSGKKHFYFTTMKLTSVTLNCSNACKKNEGFSMLAVIRVK